MSKKIRIAVFVENGFVTHITSDSPSMVDVVVVDFDDARANGETNNEWIAACTFKDGSDASDFPNDNAVVFGFAC
jgi:hypothetical protein